MTNAHHQGLFWTMQEAWDNFKSALREGASWSWAAMELLTEDKLRFRSVLNGLIGDTLDAHHSRLTIDMTLLGEVESETVCILVHGICDSEETWRYREDPSLNYGSLLRRDLGYSPLFLRYNSGLHISSNGKMLARRLNQICKENQNKIQNIVFMDNSKVSVTAVYAKPKFMGQSEIAAQLGCELTEQGLIKVDGSQKTNINGVFACGDISNSSRDISLAVASGGVAGGTCNKEIIQEEF